MKLLSCIGLFYFLFCFVLYSKIKIIDHPRNETGNRWRSRICPRKRACQPFITVLTILLQTKYLTHLTLFFMPFLPKYSCL